MDTRITATEANRRFSELLRGVRAGKSYIITSHGQPVARLAAEAADAAELRRREQAKRRLIEHWRTAPPAKIAAWTRDELHERGPWSK